MLLEDTVGLNTEFDELAVKDFKQESESLLGSLKELNVDDFSHIFNLLSCDKHVYD